MLTAAALNIASPFAESDNYDDDGILWRKEYLIDYDFPMVEIEDSFNENEESNENLQIISINRMGFFDFKGCINKNED